MKMTKAEQQGRSRTGSLSRGPHRQRGITAVELAVSILLILTLVFGSIDGARLIHTYSAVSNAAREGVRYATVRGSEAGQDGSRPSGDAPATSAQVENQVKSVYISHIPVRVTTVWPPAPGGGVMKSAGAVVEVTVESDYAPVVPFLNPITVSSTSRMVIFY